MRCPPLSTRRLVVVAPHPDDEVIGAYGLARAVLARGGRVSVVVVSDGGASHPGSRRWPPARLIAARRRECRRGLATLGLGAGAVRFLMLPDGGLTADARTARRVRRAVVAGRPDLVVGPVNDDAHADHRAVAAALTRVRGVRRLGYRVWPAPSPRGARLTVRLGAGTLAAKRRALACHRTQTRGIGDAVAGFHLDRRLAARFCRPVERFAVLA